MDAAEKFAVGLGGGEKDDKCSSCVRWVEMSSLRSLHGGDVGMETCWAHWAFIFSLDSVEGWLSSHPALDCLLLSLLLCAAARNSNLEGVIGTTGCSLPALAD